MNQMFLSAVFLQKSLAYQPRKRIFQPQVRVERNLRDFVNQKNKDNFTGKSEKEINYNFYQQLAKPRRTIIFPSDKRTGKTSFKGEKRAHRLISRDFLKNNPLSKNYTQKTTLIIAPHPDDEILGTVNLIKEKLKSREKIKIIYLTNGDALSSENNLASLNYGRYRIRESIKATRQLGLKKSDLYFLGFPDGLLSKMSRNNSLKSDFTGQNKTSPESYFPNIKFSRISMYKALKNIINEINPDEIYYTSPRDSHPDHSFLGNFMYKNFIQTPAKKFTYMIHNKNCRNDICPTNEKLDDEKLELIKIFKSQHNSSHNKKFLNQFASQKEIFWELK